MNESHKKHDRDEKEHHKKKEHHKDKEHHHKEHQRENEHGKHAHKEECCQHDQKHEHHAHHEHHHGENGKKQYAELMAVGILIGLAVGVVTTLLISSRQARQILSRSGGHVLHTGERIAEPARESIAGLKEVIIRH